MLVELWRAGRRLMKRAGRGKDISMAVDDAPLVFQLGLGMKEQRAGCQSGKVFATGGCL